MTPFPCQHCGQPVTKAQRKAYCSVACRVAARRLPDDRLAPGTRYRRVTIDGETESQHRRVAAAALGRPLLPGEIVHHENEVKLDNRPENLSVTDPVTHGLHHHPPTLPVEKRCVVCASPFKPHKTKRRRQQTCSWSCRNVLIAQRARARRAS